MSLDELPDAWDLWSQERTRVVVTYRPDVFDTENYPAPCLPTIYVTKGQRDRRPGRHTPDPDDPWHLRLYLEPEVVVSERAFDSRDSVISAVCELAVAFDAGEIAYRDAYQVPRPSYLDRLDELTDKR
jgi:hypothetical protein